ncbi:MAG: DUF4011 domain-containing protein [Planctomycetota bacterium]
MDLPAILEKTRRDLLELTARNRLIHTPLDGKRKSWLQVVDERTDCIFDLLVRRGKTLSFLGREDAEQENERDRFIEAFETADHPSAIESDTDGVDGFADRHVADRHIDSFLQTTLSPEKLQSRLLRCFYDARTAEEEQGVSILYLACGFLKWRESENSDVDRYAPLLLLPVELSRNTARSKFRLKFRDDEIVTNLSIQARLQQDFGIRLPDLPESPGDEDGWSPSAYFNTITELIEEREGWSVLEDEILLWFFSFTKFLMFRDLSTDAWPEGSELTSNKMIRGLLGEGFADGVAPPICGDDEPIDGMLNPADVIHVTDADSSQAVVIAEVAAGRNLVVQGPPGTGKSQTITNAIAAAVHAGKRVLFVSEKMAALDVVRRRLDNIGLGPLTLELHSHKARKREVLQELKATLDLGVPTGTREVPTDELRSSSVRLRRHDVVLHEPVGSSEASPYQAIGQLLQLRSAGRTALSYKVPEVTDWTPQEFQARMQLAVELDQLLEVSGNPAQNPWAGVHCSPMPPADLERLQQDLIHCRSSLQRLIELANELANELGVPEPTTVFDVSQIAQLAVYVRRCPEGTDRGTLVSPAWDSPTDELVHVIENAKSLRRLTEQLGDSVNDAAWSVDWQATRIAIAGHGKSWLRVFNASYRQAIGMLRGVCDGKFPKDADSRVDLVDSIIAIQKANAKLNADRDLATRSFGRAWKARESDFELLEQVVKWVQDAAQNSLMRRHGRAIAARFASLDVLAEPIERITKSLGEVDGRLNDLAEALKLDANVALESDDVGNALLATWLDRIAAWLAAPEQLSHYLATESRVTRLREGGLRGLAQEVSDGSLRAGEVEDQLRTLLAESVLARAWRERAELAEFHGETYEKLRERFATLDQQRIRLSRLEVAKRHHENLPVTSAESGQVSVVKREINKKRRHLPLRRLLTQAGHAVQKIKPVFMMSPLSVAQYLEPGAVEFDLLVIDEASQVQPVDALGAIARSKQVVVVGDQRQLPPTDFFGRISGDDSESDENDTVNASDLESILGLCEAQGLPSRMLRWHYRSRHESLIAVSNRQFYEDRLFIVPSPLVSGGSLGLKLRYVADGWYDRGGSRVNRNEAKAVADAVMEHAVSNPEMSLGVATFSAAQRDAIIDELEVRRRADPSVEAFFTLDGMAPFFVKSLENVQGDERDVVFISVGYAKDRNGYFAQNFGPLNRKGGERRLNVLISRASAACTVFTSLKPDEIDLTRTQSEGVAALKMFLQYAELGRLDASHSHRGADSLFEEQVAKALCDRGLEVDHKIGVGGFLIDLAIRDPERSGRYLLGIECDGAQYHNARWVRDRDRIREQVLQRRGWILHRIWSTDWFQRPEEQLDHVLEALAHAKTHWDEFDRAEAAAATIIQQRVAIETVDEGPLWERVEVCESKQAIGGSSADYVQASFDASSFDGGPADLDEGQLDGLMQRIIEIEAPIHVDEVGRRCISILGQGRLVASLKRKVAASAERLAEQAKAELRGDFLYRCQQTEFSARNRRGLDNAALRRVENIASEELCAAIIDVVRDHIGTDESETFRSVAKVLGMSNSKSFQAAVRTQLEHLSSRGIIDERSGKLFVG